MVPLNAQCDCLTSNNPEISPMADLTICQGDTTQLFAELLPGSVSSFPDAYFIERDPARVGQNLVKYNTSSGFDNSEDISSLDAVFAGSTFKEDSLFFLIRPNVLVKTQPDSLPLAFDTLSFPDTRPGQLWVGLTFDDATESFYALSNQNSQSLSLLYSLNEMTGDTTLLSTLPHGSRWLSSDGAGTLYVGNSRTDSLYSIDATTGAVEGIGAFGFSSLACQGADFDQTSGELYGLFFTEDDESVLGFININDGSFCAFDTVGSEMACPLSIRNSMIDNSQFTFSWSPIDSLSSGGVYNPLAWPGDTMTYTVTVTDICGNSSSESVTINVIQAPDPLNSQACLSDVNIYLGQDCSAEITPDALLTPDYHCPNEFYEVTIDGRPEPFVDGGDIGTTVEATVQPVGGGNSCTSNVTVNDDLPPSIVNCDDITLSFSDLVPELEGEDNCDPNPTVTNSSIEFTDTVSCNTPFLYAATQTGFATDASGNQGDDCERTIYFFAPTANEITFPDSLSEATENFLSCDTTFPTTPNGIFPAPSFSGEPMINGFTIADYPPQVPIDVHMEDIPLVINQPCKVSFLRVWNVVVWDCNEADTVASYQQLIQILDKEGPTFDLPQIDTLSTNSNSDCFASVTLPYPSNANDNCTDIDRVSVTYGMNTIPDLLPGGATVELPLGQTEVIYRVYDECLNSTLDTLTLTVIDENEPTVVCRSPNVGLNTSGPTRVYAQSFDDGSYDDCGSITLEIARMTAACGYDDSFGPYLEFTCCDVGADVNVILRATDEAGNVNICMTTIEVQDKSDPEIVAPDDITVSCEFPVDFNNLSVFGKVVPTDDINAVNNRSLEPDVEEIILTDPGVDPVGPTVYGLDGVAFDNCGFTIDESYEVEDLGCNSYMIERTFKVLANGEVGDSATQLVYVQNIAEFSEADITWPKDTMLVNACNGVDTHPDSLNVPHAYPRFNNGPCNNVVVSEPEDTRFFTLDPNDNTCYKILRKWQVMDWCSQEPNGDPIVFEHFQLIKVVNNDGPEFTTPGADIVECSIDSTCDNGFIALIQEAEDDCTAEEDLRWSYTIDLFSDGSIDQVGSSSDASGEYPIGIHQITWTVEDGCKNRANRMQTFEIESCKLPTPICRPGITVELTPMYIGNDTFAMSEISADLVGGDSYHSCGYDVRVSFSSNPDDTTLVLDCDDVGTKEIEIYVTDEKGRQDLCRTYLLIQDNTMTCGNDPGPVFPVTGSITNSATSKGLPDTELHITGGINFMTLSDENGYFEFPGLTGGDEYTIQPKKDGDDLNGVSTFDVLLIQQHILGINEFDSPYKHIAGDVDGNRRITGRDIIELRKLILGIYDELPDNESWRFVDADFDFGQKDPLDTDFPESYVISDLSSEMHIGFEPVKIGDINMSANFQGRQAQTRFDDEYLFTSDEQRLESDQNYSVPLYLEDVTDLYGFQAEWMFNPNILTVHRIQGEQVELTDAHVENIDGRVRISWSTPKGQEIDPKTPLFYIELTARKTTRLSTSLQLAAVRDFSSEVYTIAGEHEANFRVKAENLAMPSFELKQNRPNPVSNQTIIDFQIPVSMHAELVVTDGSGKEVYRKRSFFSRGWNQFSLDKNNLGSSGLYLYQVSAGPFSESKKMILID
jgi:hypothetical protein